MSISPGGASLASLPVPAFGAHRGGRHVAPEETLTAFRAMVAAGVDYLDMDARMLGDGTVVIHHDSTVDRMTSSTGRLSRMTAPGYKRLRTRPDVLAGAVWPELELPTAAEVLDEFGGRIVMTIEAKDTTVIPPLAAMIHARGLAGSVLINTNDPTVVADIRAQGVLAHLWRDSSQCTPADIAAVTACAPDVLEVDYALTDAHIAAYRAALPPTSRLWAHCTPAHADRDRLISLGITGIVGDDPIHMSGRACGLAQDPFAQQTWWHGAYPGSGSDRGSFEPPNAWGYATASASWRGVHQQIRVPDALTATSYTISLDVKLTAAQTDTRWLALYLMPDDRLFCDGRPDPGRNGWGILMRQRGDLDIYKYVNGQSAKVGEGGQTTDFTLGAWAPVTITVTPAAISATRPDTSEGATTVNDAAYRGRHLWLAASGAAGRFRNITIS